MREIDGNFYKGLSHRYFLGIWREFATTSLGMEERYIGGSLPNVLDFVNHCVWNDIDWIARRRALQNKKSFCTIKWHRNSRLACNILADMIWLTWNEMVSNQKVVPCILSENRLEQIICRNERLWKRFGKKGIYRSEIDKK